MPPEAEPQEKLNALTESQRLSARTEAKPQHADGVWLLACSYALPLRTERRESGSQARNVVYPDSFVIPDQY